MLPVKILQRLGRKVTTRLASHVAKNELFEQHGERARQRPLDPLTAAPVAEVPSHAPEPAERPTLSGCTPMDAAEVKALLGPAAQTRIVNHWATWCDPCIEELPVLVDLHRRLGGSVELLGVSWDLFEGGTIAETAEKVSTFAQEHGLTWATALVTTPPESFFGALDIDWKRIPQTWIIDPSGRIVRRIEGVLDAEAADALVAELT
jgi:thiol-disulfide isomerase/thioredoxin